MMSTNNVLLASHGSDGAKAAEQMAIQLCEKGARIHHLVVVPTLWEGMTGDDWLNNGSTRDRFRRYLESELEQEVAEHCERVSHQAEENNIGYSNEVVVGDPEQCLLDVSNKQNFDLIVMGSPRPKGIKGLRSRMATEPVTRSLQTPLLIVPYPHD
jgi:nucleotide-binding universal stress UspA family protein